jgi:DNA-directed RNA polymerase I subunit RPA49
MVGVFDKGTNELTLRHAPLYLVRHQVKVFKDPGPIPESGHDYQHARNVLGEAFGTKKAKAAIRSAEKNKVDVAAMKDVCASADPETFSS